MGGALPLTLAGLTAALWLVVAGYGQFVAQRLLGIPLLGLSAAVATGAYLTAALTPGLPLLAAVVVAALVAACGGGLLGLAVSVLHRGDPGVATWAGGWLALALIAAGGGDDALVANPVRLVLPAAGLAITAGTDMQFAVAAAIMLLTCFLVRRSAAGPLGPRLAVTRAAPSLAAEAGLPVTAYRCLGLGVASLLGALGGAGFLVLQGVSGSADVSPLLSVSLLAIVLAGGARWWGPLAGCAAFVALTRLTDPSIATAVLVALGVVRLTVSPPRIQRPAVEPIAPKPVGPAALASVGPAALRLEGVTVRLDGQLILDGVSLELRPGEVHALIGPNGAGKSTLIGVLSGRLSAPGRVTLDGAALPAGSAGRVRAGVVATSQALVLPAGLTALEQVAAAVPYLHPAAGARHLLGAASRGPERRWRSGRAAGWLELLGVTDTGRSSETLSGVEQRLVQIARAAATGARVIALDEPGAGVERDRIATAIRALAGLGIAVLLVEHDIRLIRAVADRVSVCVAGRIVATGEVSGVLADPAVGRAYLGFPGRDDAPAGHADVSA